MEKDVTEFVETQVNGETIRFASYTGALKLCANINYETEILDFIDRMSPGDIFYDLGTSEDRYSIYLRTLELPAMLPKSWKTILRRLDPIGQ